MSRFIKWIGVVIKIVMVIKAMIALKTKIVPKAKIALKTKIVPKAKIVLKTMIPHLPLTDHSSLHAYQHGKIDEFLL
ncbi:hypothetical protein AND4_10949 [Vibrio sp. AND4]|nr:hypothetical protein AND4_10949 [Vibrio sp. AND4]